MPRRTPSPKLDLTALFVMAVALGGCSTSPSGSDVDAGSTGSGGAPGTGTGGTVTSSGGAPGSGGVTVGSGGASSGGATGTGAGGTMIGSGGRPGSGGVTTAGGAPGIGAGGRSVGGALGSGGATASGGVTSSPGGAGGAVTSKGGSNGTAGGGTDDPCGPNNPATVPLPVIPAGTFDVTTHGAVGDGKTDDTAALQATLDAATAAGGGTVVVPSGTFLSGPIVIGSSTRLQLSTGAILEMLPMAKYPAGATAFITSAGTAHDIAITGTGTIEGQGQDWWNAFAADSTVERPQEVSLGHVTRVQVSGIKLQNSPEEHIWVKSDTNVTITGITISTLAVSGKSPPKNTDGVDVTADGMFFCNNDIACGDDNIAMSGTNLYLAYSSFGVGHGCSIGSITKNGVSGVTVDHLTMNGTTSGIRLKSARDRGGLVQNLAYTNITMTNVQNPIYITSYYPTLPTDPTADTAMAVTATTPLWQNITIKNLTATGSTNAGVLWGLPEAKISQVVFDDVKIQATTGMQIVHATGISFVNGSTVTPKSGAAVTVSDATVSGITTTAF